MLFSGIFGQRYNMTNPTARKTAKSNNYHVKTAKTIKEDEELIEAGFEYVTEKDGAKIYRKRK
jgi:hypothetical protein